MAQELGITLLISRGVCLLTASGDDLTASDDPSRKMMRQIAGAFAEYEKARLVSKLRHARERVRQEKGKCEGRKPHVELRPEAVALAKRLHRSSPKTGKRMSLRKIAAELAEEVTSMRVGSHSTQKACAVCLTGDKLAECARQIGSENILIAFGARSESYLNSPYGKMKNASDAAAITPVAVQPQIAIDRDSVSRPMILELRTIIIITAMSGAANTPLTTAAQ